MSRILRFLAIFCVTLFVGSAFAATGYVCDSYRKYTSCAEGYYLANANGTYNATPAVGNQCISCAETDSGNCPGGTESPKYPVILCDEEGSGECYEIYASENGGIFCENWEDCENTEITKVEIPEREPDGLASYTFLGYYDSDGEIQYIDAEGNFTADATDDFINSHSMGEWYVKWEKNTGGCPAGYHVNAAGDACVKCEAGTYQSENGYTETTCTECGAGKYTNETGSTSASACKNITAGCYGTSAGSACPAVCEPGKYSNAGAASCTSCPNTAYTNSGSDAAAHAGVKSCKITCNPGSIVATPRGGCVTNTTTGWFGFSNKHTVAYGDVSTISYCPTGFSEGANHMNSCEACVGTGPAGEVISNVIPAGTMVKIINNGSTDLGIANIVAMNAYDIAMGTEGFLNSLGGDKLSNLDYFLDGDIDTTGRIKGGGYFVFSIGGNSNVASIDVAFAGNGVTVNPYTIEFQTPADTSWTPLFTSSPDNNSANMGVQGTTYNKRFILYSKRDSDKGYYMPQHEVRLCEGILDTRNQISCSTATDGKYPESDYGTQQVEGCFANCATTDVGVNNGAVSAVQYSQVSMTVGQVCRYKVSCNTGYEVAGDDSVTSNGTTYYSNPSCNAGCYKVTFDNGDVGGNTVISARYGSNGWYGNGTCTGTAITSIAMPNGTDWDFAGYWDTSNMTDISQDTDVADNGTEKMILAPLPKGDNSTVLGLDNLDGIDPATHYRDITLFLRKAKACTTGSGALCLGPYYYYNADEKYIYYINCCLPGYHSDVLDVSSDGTTCPSGT